MSWLRARAARPTPDTLHASLPAYAADGGCMYDRRHKTCANYSAGVELASANPASLGWHYLCSSRVMMMLLFRRFVGALALSPAAFEDIEADRLAGMQSVL